MSTCFVRSKAIILLLQLLLVKTVFGWKVGRNFLGSRMSWCRFLLHFSLLLFILTAQTSSYSISMGTKVLHIGKELRKEILPLEMGSCLYQLQGLQSQKWYEVKISYPASIPTSFSLQLKKGISDVGMNSGRKLLNTEKLIFKTDGLDNISDQGGLYVLVNVQSEGFVAIPGVQERKHVIFNIVCDELLLGIPHEAWYVVMLVLLCLGIALMIPSFLPPYLLPRNKNLHVDRASSKDS